MEISRSNSSGPAITYVFATLGEAKLLLSTLTARTNTMPVRVELRWGAFYDFGSSHVLICGIGVVNSALANEHYLSLYKPSLMLMAGIAGSFVPEYPIGAVVNIASEQYGDFGAQTADGGFLDIADLGFPEFTNPVLHNPDAGEFGFLPAASGITVSTIAGEPHTIALRVNKFNPAIETMEGAPFFEVCLKHGVKFLQIRSISNFVEPRNRDNWNIPLALRKLHEVLCSVDELIQQA